MNEPERYLEEVIQRFTALKPAVFEWDMEAKMLNLYVPPIEHKDLQRSDVTYDLKLTEEEIIFMCHARTDIMNLLNINRLLAADNQKLRSQNAKPKRSRSHASKAKTKKSPRT